MEKTNIYTLVLNTNYVQENVLGHYSSLENARRAATDLMSKDRKWIEETSNYWIKDQSGDQLEIVVKELDPDHFDILQV